MAIPLRVISDGAQRRYDFKYLCNGLDGRYWILVFHKGALHDIFIANDSRMIYCNKDVKYEFMESAGLINQIRTWKAKNKWFDQKRFDEVSDVICRIERLMRQLSIFKRQWKRKTEASRVIQRRFREAISNPEFVLCKQRLLREFGELAVH
jgi:hypothetical protein